MSVKTGVPKDVFIVHSKSDKMHAELVDLLGVTLASFGRSLWEYSDWDWEVERQGVPRYYWSGSSADEIDPVRHSAGLAPFRRRQKFTEVNEESLDKLLQRSRVLILLSPMSGQLSAGSLIEVERIAALTGRGESRKGDAPRPLIIEALWTDNPLPDFAVLTPVLRLTLTNDNPREAARLAAAFVSAWVVHTLQTTYGVSGQHLLSRIASEDQMLIQLVTRSPNYRTLDYVELEERSRLRERQLHEDRPKPEPRWEKRAPGMVSEPSPDYVRTILRQMDMALAPVLGSERFSGWLDGEVAPIRAWVDAHVNGSEETNAANFLLRGITTNWKDSFKRFEWAETTFDRAGGYPGVAETG